MEGSRRNEGSQLLRQDSPPGSPRGGGSSSQRRSRYQRLCHPGARGDHGPSDINGHPDAQNIPLETFTNNNEGEAEHADSEGGETDSTDTDEEDLPSEFRVIRHQRFFRYYDPDLPLDMKTILKILMEEGKDLSKTDSRKRTVLHLVAKEGHPKMCKLIIEYDRKQEHKQLTATDKRGLTPIHYAIKAPRAQRSPYKDADPDRVATAKLLLEEYPNTVDNIREDAKGRTLYHYAAKYNNVVIMRLFEERSDKLQQLEQRQRKKELNQSRDTSTGRSPLHDAVIQGSKDAVNELLKWHGYLSEPFDLKDETDENGSTFLHSAAAKGNVNIIEYLNERMSGKIKDPSILSCADKNGQTILHRAAAKKQAEFLRQVLHRIEPFPAEALNKEDNRCKTALDVAVYTGCPHTVAALLEANAHSNQGIDLEQAWIRGHYRMVECLLDNGVPLTKEGALLTKALFSPCSPGGVHRCVEGTDAQKAMCAMQFAFYRKVFEKIRKLKDDKRVTCQELLNRVLIGDFDARGHYAALKHWHQGLCEADFEHLVKHPEFLLMELDALVLRKPDLKDDADATKQDLYYQVFHDLTSDSGKYRVCTDLLDYDDPLERLETVIETGSSAVRDHPVFRLCVRNLWMSVMPFYIPAIVFLLIFSSVFTSFMATYTTQPEPSRANESYNSSLDGETLWCVPGESGGLWRHVVLLWIACLSLLVEGFEIYVRRGMYFRVPHNLMDWFTYVGCIVVVSAVIYSQADVATNVAAEGCLVYGSHMWVVGLFVQIIAWFNFISKCRVIPSLGIYVSMVERVFQSFMHFSPALVLYLATFGLTFHLALPRYFGYADVGMSVLNTWVMMTGEMGYLDLAGSDDLATLGDKQWLLHVLYVMFLVVLSLIIMNLLTGIAVSDVNTIREMSEEDVMRFQIELCRSTYTIIDALQGIFKRCPKNNREGNTNNIPKESGEWFENGKFVGVPTIGDNFTYVPTEAFPFPLGFLDSIFFGPDFKMAKIQKSLEERGKKWEIVPNMAWRIASMDRTSQDVANRFEVLRKHAVALEGRLNGMEEKDKEIMKKLDEKLAEKNKEIMKKLDEKLAEKDKELMRKLDEKLAAISAQLAGIVNK